MNRSLHKKRLTLILAWAGMFALCGAIAVAQDKASAVGQRSDGAIEMDVVHALDTAKALKDDLITAATIQSEVTLSGTVSSEASSELAEALAAHVTGVSKVNNNLKVGDPQAAEAAADGSASGTTSQPESADNTSSATSAPDVNDGPMAVPNQTQSQDQESAPLPPARPRYARVRPAPPVYAQPKGPVIIPQGTLLQVRTSEPVNSKRAKDGEPVQFAVIRDVASGGVLAIPRGATVHGVVTEVKKSGALAGTPEVALKLTSLDLGGQSYPLDSDQFKVKGPGKGGQTANNVIGGAIVGTMIGAILGRGPGAAIGAAAGAGAGTAASAASPGAGAWIPAEALVDFHLTTALTVTPVSAQEAARLAQGLYHGGPSLYRRGEDPYGQPYYADYPYGYPPVYYRPYYVTGGYYYWR